MADTINGLKRKRSPLSEKIPVLFCSDYVRKYFDVKKRAFLRNNMRDFDGYYAKFSFVHNPRNIRCEIRAFALKIMRVSNLLFFCCCFFCHERRL